jgi:hypothetical protein
MMMLAAALFKQKLTESSPKAAFSEARFISPLMIVFRQRMAAATANTSRPTDADGARLDAGARMR